MEMMGFNRKETKFVVMDEENIKKNKRLMSRIPPTTNQRERTCKALQTDIDIEYLVYNGAITEDNIRTFREFCTDEKYEYILEYLKSKKGGYKDKSEYNPVLLIVSDSAIRFDKIRSMAAKNFKNIMRIDSLESLKRAKGFDQVVIVCDRDVTEDLGEDILVYFNNNKESKDIKVIDLGRTFSIEEGVFSLGEIRPKSLELISRNQWDKIARLSKIWMMEDADNHYPKL